ncbi:MAG: hypothetical protein QOJ82_163, partial [Solirubrobacteraceae bacterium]|nr:hypothetical protein [Solirubrobacteraceae bacterium]
MAFARLLPLVLAALLLLTFAPAAGAHEGADVDHRDTPGELADADITRAMAVARLGRVVASTLPDYLPATWCGVERTDDDVANAAFPSTSARIKVVYAHAADQPDRFANWSDALQGTVGNVERYLAGQTGGLRALRFDMGTSCGPQYVDIQVVHLPSPRSYYLDQFSRVRNDVAAALGPTAGPRNVYIVADRLTASGVYGQGEVWSDDSPGAGNAHNGGGFTAIMWMNSTTAPSTTGWQPTVMLHEITHNLGGVQPSAPHSTPYSHCWDGQDVMCYADGSTGSQPYTSTICPTISGALPQTFDCNRDDYFNPAPAPGSYLATHWNVYRSVFLGPCSQLGSACGGATVPAPPVNTSAPVLWGAARRAAALTATAGDWLNDPTAFAITWQRSVAGGAWQTIAGASAASYAPTADDVGAVVRVIVTATNSDGAATATSMPTDVVADLPAAAPVAPIARPAPPATTSSTVRIVLR